MDVVEVSHAENAGSRRIINGYKVQVVTEKLYSNSSSVDRVVKQIADSKDADGNRMSYGSRLLTGSP